MTIRLVRSVAKSLEAVLFEAPPSAVDRAMRTTPRASVQRLVSAHGVAPRFLRVLTSPYEPHPIVLGVLANESDALLQRRALALQGPRRRRYRTEHARAGRYEAIRCLIDSLRRDGFRPPVAVGDTPDAIGVIVRDDGRLTWLRQGDHRLSLSKALELPFCVVRIWAFEPAFVSRARRHRTCGSIEDAVLEALATHGIRRIGG